MNALTRTRLATRARISPVLAATLSLVGLFAAVAVVWFGIASPTATDAATSAALNYGQSEMMWYGTPHVQSARVVSLRSLSQALTSSVAPNVRRDINVRDLVRNYGPNKRVKLVILRGTYNSLPPDEGVTVHGDVVVLVDEHSLRPLLLMD